MPPPILEATALVQRLRAGEAAIIPTDTLPGLAVMPDQAQTLWHLKRRPADKPLILMGATVDDLLQEVDVSCHREVEALAGDYWPGALTLVLPACDGAACHLNPGGRTLGCRIPACKQTRELLQISGPLATTSANRSGEPASMTSADASRYFPDVAQLGPQPWPQPSGQASTVLVWVELGRWRMARRGAVIPEGLEVFE
ncbi:L-threonylcarbamoyladenylate synthase [Synechococcus sp. HB1133]|nr:L-threonylcarbamoyladenylate synthase [Synechococcus sp. HB1133]MCB4395156.1 L-threonylcarbamoyladenylate synthase [Synechococcus sp. PH41509]MCB4423105.1 L-threonylcarbamoyladenylate synthase [Synechococcus sp. HB1133]MCB4431746.1 L-threonylcarbamoyladenylate synthase [Synechococcus sp. HBA1120]NHI82053.1 Sua5/YciO/YrdC/YwlC family protein [Synechococcus sp. HB1133]